MAGPPLTSAVAPGDGADGAGHEVLADRGQGVHGLVVRAGADERDADAGDGVVVVDAHLGRAGDVAGWPAARRPSSSIAAVISGEVTSVALITTSTPLASEGKAAVTLSYVFITGKSLRDRSSAPVTVVFMCSAGAARASRTPPATMIETSGRRRTCPRIQPQTRESPLSLPSRESSGTRLLWTRWPSLTSTAGRIVSEPSTATATTRMEPVANEKLSASPDRYMPAVAIMTVKPEMSTARPLVAAAASSAASAPLPLARSSRSRLR